MSESEDKLKILQTRLDNLAKYEAAFKREIADIRREINLLKVTEKPETKAQTPKEKPRTEKPKESQKSQKNIPPQPEFEKSLFESPIDKKSKKTPKEKSEIEKFVGKYLISIIGVLVTIIGVGIGAKYAIDNNLISPLMRIVFGYVVGLGLVGFAVKLKSKYHTFSSVLLSGGMAIMYFITYFAYSFYSLIPSIAAFTLMVIFTVLTVLAAIIYNRQVIAHIGLVGAYAVPFLLSENSGRVDILFSYISIINVGILVVSLKKYWKYLFYSAFIITWLIYAVWYLDSYDHTKHFALSLTFLGIFFSIFYLTFLGYKLIHKKPFNLENVGLILQNSFTFFGFGYAILDNSVWDKFLGLFAIGNSFIHYLVASIIYKYKLGDRKVFYLVVALSITFLTIAIPVQFDGNWITILWIAEATFLFIIGRTKKIALFEYFAYALMIFASVSLLNDWQQVYDSRSYDIAKTIYPLLNKDFLTSIFVTICFGVIFFVDRNKNYIAQTENSIYLIIKYFIPSVLLIALYNTFRMEIDNYFYYQSVLTAIEKPSTDYYDYVNYLTDSSLNYFNGIWQIKYTMFFLTILGYLNIKKIKSSSLGFINLSLNSFLIFIFITLGLVWLGLLRENYLNQINADNFNRGIYHLVIRYFAFVFLAGIIAVTFEYIKQEFITKYISRKYLSIAFDLGLSFVILVILSNELIHWTDIYKIDESNKLGLSILWSLFAVTLIVIGIIKRKKHLRIFAISLFAVTLVKLFVYDIAELETIPKTIAFVTTGILLLIASFLYNKYTKLIFDEENT